MVKYVEGSFECVAFTSSSPLLFSASRANDHVLMVLWMYGGAWLEQRGLHSDSWGEFHGEDDFDSEYGDHLFGTSFRVYSTIESGN